jgi:hypothetical protein
MPGQWSNAKEDAASSQTNGTPSKFYLRTERSNHAVESYYASLPSSQQQGRNNCFTTCWIYATVVEIVHFIFFQQLLSEYITVAGHDKDLTTNLVDHSLHMLSTRAGTDVVIYCTAYGTAKDRKRILKALKGYTKSSLLHRDASSEDPDNDDEGVGARNTSYSSKFLDPL